MVRAFVLWVIVGALAGPAVAGDLPDVKSQSACVIDASTGAEIFGKDADEIRPIASTTKIFVAMAVRQHGLDLEGWTEITKQDAREARGGARTRLDVGERFRNRDLLRAMLIASDNRAPTALGRAAGLDREDLIAAMNAVAKRLHLTRTRFTDPTGLRGNVSTAREMAIALRAALGDDVLREIMGDPYEEVVAQGHRRGIGYGTTNQPLVAHRYEVIGGKTGYTEAAGYCYITAARLHGKEIVMAFLGAEGKLTRFADFNRVAAWLDRGAPGAEVDAMDEPPDDAAAPIDLEVRGKVEK
ncbi:MAG TPA: serine hydrolase [Kofleriaceae bacterium]|nr:serine hydrolase [Kofleriaceae bacterium]